MQPNPYHSTNSPNVKKQVQIQQNHTTHDLMSIHRTQPSGVLSRKEKEEIYKTVRSLREPSETPTIIAPKPTHGLTKSQKESIYGTLKKRSKTSEEIYAQLWTIPKHNPGKDSIRSDKTDSKTGLKIKTTSMIQTPCYYDIYEDPNKIKQRIQEKATAKIEAANARNRSPSPSQNLDTEKTESLDTDDEEEDYLATKMRLREKEKIYESKEEAIRKKQQKYSALESKEELIDLKKDEIYDYAKDRKNSKSKFNENYKELAKDFETLLIKKENELRKLKIQNNNKVNECKAKINYLADKVRDQRKDLNDKDRKINAKRKQINELLDKTDKYKKELKGRDRRDNERDNKDRDRDKLRDRDRDPSRERKNKNQPIKLTLPDDLSSNDLLLEQKHKIVLRDLEDKIDLLEEEKEQVQKLSNQKLDIAAKKIKELVVQVKTMHENYEELNNENHHLKLNEIKSGFFDIAGSGID